MWHIYTLIAVLLRGAYCIPVINTADQSQCTTVIKRFDESVTTLEVEWNSTIYLICDASCVGPGPQPGLTWFYKDKNRSKHISIEKLFRSPKFETHPINSYRGNELTIRDFGPNEETKFICKGSYKAQKLKAEVELIGTDCVLKYNFRCKSNKRCIDRGYLCNQNNECPDGEDEVGCGNNINSTTVATTRMPVSTVEIKQTSEESDNMDMTTTVSTMKMPETDVETKQTSEESIDITMTVSTMRMQETDMETKQTTEERKPCEFQCRNGACIASTKKCDGIPDCPDHDDEICDLGLICPEGKKACKDSSACIDNSQRCNGVLECTDGGDEEDCDLGTKPQTTKAPQQEDEDYYDVSDDKVKIIMVNSRINVDGDKELVSTTDGITARTGDLITTTPFEYEIYID